MNGFTGRSGPVIRCPGAAGVAGGAGGPGGAGAVRGAGGEAAGPENRGIAGGRGGAGAGAATPPPGAAGARWAAVTGGGFAAPPCGFTGNTLLHTAQRARTPPAGTLAGSTRNTVSHDGQVTFTLPLCSRYLAPASSSSSGSCRRSTTNTDPGCVFA